MARPALSEEERLSRHTALLDAARRLYREKGTLPSVSDIAKAAGMAKGAVYLWFRSKEEIYVALLEASLLEFMSRLLPVIVSLNPSPSLAPEVFATQYARVLAAVPDLMPLSSLHSRAFRTNLPVESLSRMNRNVGEGLSRAGDLLEQRLGCLSPGQGPYLLLQTWTLSAGLWQLMDIPDEVKNIPGDPIFTVFRRGFHAELEAAVAQLWRGAMTTCKSRTRTRSSK